MAEKSVLATIEGTMLAPGISKNNRLYTQSTIGRAVNRMQERLRSPQGLPVVMRTHHGAGDDSSKIVGRITDIHQENDGSASYKAVLYNNTAGRDLAPLLKPDEVTGKPALRTTSIYGYWVGPVEQVQHNGTKAETGNDLEIDALDFTQSPGVSQSQIKSVTFESAHRDGRSVLMESMDATVTLEPVSEDMDDWAQVAEFGEVQVWERKFTAKQRKSMAAAGQAMPGGRYPIANKSDLRNAIHAVGRGAGSHDAIRQHIIRRARALGLSSMIPDNWSSSGSRKESSLMSKATAEHFVKIMVGSEIQGEELKVCAYDISPDIIKDAIKQGGKIIDQVLGQSGRGVMDPDEDDLITDVDDIDWKIVTCSPDGDGDDYDSDDADTMPDGMGGYGKESAGSLSVVINGRELDAKIAQFRNAYKRRAREARRTDKSIETKESAVAEDTKAVDQAAPSGLTEADLAKIGALIGAAVKEAMDAAAGNYNAAAKGKAKGKKGKADTSDNGPAGSTESAEKDAKKVVGESLSRADVEKLLTEERAKITAELRESIIKENGLPQRQGFRTKGGIGESDEKPPTSDELWDKRSEIWAQVLPLSTPTVPASATADAA